MDTQSFATVHVPAGVSAYCVLDLIELICDAERFGLPAGSRLRERDVWLAESNVVIETPKTGSGEPELEPAGKEKSARAALQNVDRYVRAREIAADLASAVRSGGLVLRNSYGRRVELTPESDGYVGALIQVDESLVRFLVGQFGLNLVLPGRGHHEPEVLSKSGIDDNVDAEPVLTLPRYSKNPDSPRPVATKDLAGALHRVGGKDSAEWEKLLGDAKGNAKWALPARVESSTKRGAPARWDPLELARILMRRGGGRQLLDRAFRESDALADWREEWQREQAAFRALAREYGVE